MVFHGFWLISMVFQGVFIVFHGFWLVSMIFQGGFMVFYGFWLVSMVFQGGFMVFYWFPWFFKVVSWFFMDYGWFPWFCWLRTPQNCILAQRSGLGFGLVTQSVMKSGSLLRSSFDNAKRTDKNILKQ